MLFHQLRQHLVLGPQLLLQGGDPLLLPLASGIRLALVGRRAILEKHLQPTAKDRGMNLVFLTQAGDAFLLDQVAAQNSHLFLRGILPTTVFHGVLPPLF